MFFFGCKEDEPITSGSNKNNAVGTEVNWTKTNISISSTNAKVDGFAKSTQAVDEISWQLTQTSTGTGTIMFESPIPLTGYDKPYIDSVGNQIYREYDPTFSKPSVTRIEFSPSVVTSYYLYLLLQYLTVLKQLFDYLNCMM